MMPAQPANPRNNANGNNNPGDSNQAFEGVFERAAGEYFGGSHAAPTIIDIEPRALLDYVAGRSGQEEDQRAQVETFVASSTWAYDRVLSLVRATRPTQTPGVANVLAKRLLADTKQDALKTVAGAVLELEGEATQSFEQLAGKLEKSGSAKARAACYLGLGRIDDARKVLEKIQDKDATTQLLWRITTTTKDRTNTSDDETLITLLDAFPSLCNENKTRR